MKNINEFILDEKPSLTVYSWDNMISEDERNSSKKIYDENIFKNIKCFKISVDNEDEEEMKEKEKKKREEERKRKFEEYINHIDKVNSEIESNTNQIKRDMELDEKKREELERQEQLRIERERKIREEREKKLREEREKKLREERERKLREEREKKRREEESQMENNMIKNDIYENGGTVRERLIKAAKNYDNIKKEVDKINNNEELKEKTDKITLTINGTIGKISSLEDIDKGAKELSGFLNEVKEGNHKDFYFYICFVILRTIIRRISSIIDVSENFLNHCIFSKIIAKINSKTLTYMLFQIISNSCPYIIPALNINQNSKKLRTKEEIEEHSNKNLNIGYFYFIFLYLDINKNINIIEDYINNIGKLKSNEINYLIANSFVSFIDVFGNYIKRHKNDWFVNILNIQNEIKKGLEIEIKSTKNPVIQSIINVISLDLTTNIDLLKKDQLTNFMNYITNKIRI